MRGSAKNKCQGVKLLDAHKKRESSATAVRKATVDSTIIAWCALSSSRCVTTAASRRTNRSSEADLSKNERV